jgi:hypothetical protein
VLQAAESGILEDSIHIGVPKIPLQLGPLLASFISLRCFGMHLCNNRSRAQSFCYGARSSVIKGEYRKLSAGGFGSAAFITHRYARVALLCHGNFA